MAYKIPQTIYGKSEHFVVIVNNNYEKLSHSIDISHFNFIFNSSLNKCVVSVLKSSMNDFYKFTRKVRKR